MDFVNPRHARLRRVKRCDRSTRSARLARLEDGTFAQGGLDVRATPARSGIDKLAHTICGAPSVA
jgi:hypothetical protein